MHGRYRHDDCGEQDRHQKCDGKKLRPAKVTAGRIAAAGGKKAKVISE
jgi:hypothetical protein